MLHRLPQCRVVDAEVDGLVVLDGAALGPGGGHRDARGVDPAGRFQRALQLKVEAKIRSALAYEFCAAYGESQGKYLGNH